MRLRRASIGGFVAASFALSLLVSPAAAAPSGRATLTGSVPSWATSAAFKGAPDPSGNVGFRVYLGWTDDAGAQALARAVSDPHSASYGHYLTPAQFRARFSPPQPSVNAVTSWLRAQGFTVDYVPRNNHYVSAEGTVAQAAAAFGTTFGLYAYQGDVLLSPSSDLTIPASLSGVVEGVVGLDDTAALVHTDHVVADAPPSAGFRNAPPLADWFGQLTSPYAFPAGYTADPAGLGAVPWTVKGYTPAQIKGVYGIPSQYDGNGQTVAIIDAYASPTILADVNQWSQKRGLPQFKGSQFQQVVAPGTYNRPQVVNKRKIVQDPQGWYGEETLDVEAVHGMAPAANVVYVGAPNNYQDLDAAMNHVVDAHLADIVTNSYGFTTELLHPGFIKPFEDTLVQAAAEGIGVYFSSGDNGDETSVMGYATPDWPASSPWVTAVGGTSLGIGAANERVVETGWGTNTYSCNPNTLACVWKGWLYGAGGGTSRIFAKPWYQSGLSGSGRMVPDVAALGDPQTGLLIGQTQSFPNGPSYDEYRIGGTSVSSPIFAGIMALADQTAGHPHGFATPFFYANAGSFYDVLSVKTAVARANYVNGVDASAGIVFRLRTFDDYRGSPTQSTGPGWDNVTGLGTPHGLP
ncbi:MAG TPA: S53 family peptidase [Candidatus Dormibacteraeota bacterium]|nr:S53 family peptidase [Candidatus Dormibacteraeota bacterium]